MEMNRKTNNRGLTRLLSLLTVLALCFVLAGQAFAAGENEAVTPETVAAALDALTARMDEAETAAHGKTVAGLKAEAYARQDVLEAVETASRGIAAAEAIREKAALLKQNIQKHPVLTDSQKAQFAAKVDSLLEGNTASAVDMLMEEAQLALEDTAYKMSAAKLEERLGDLAELEAQADGLADVVNAIALLPEIDAELAKLKGVLTDNGEAGAGENLLILQLEELTRCREAVNASLEGIGDLDAQAQAALAEDIRTLAGDLENFVAAALVDAVRSLDAADARLEQTNEEFAASQKKLVFSYIALALSVIGLLMTLVVAIFAIGKARGEQVDLSTMASREDAEALSRQNAVLKRQLDQQSLRLDAIARELEKVKAVPAAPAEPVIPVEAVVEPAAQKVPAAEPEKPILGSSQQVCNLKIHYQSINPSNSYLTENPAGTMILFADGTVEMVPDKMQMSNGLSGWTANGTFFLFDPEVDGKVLDIQRDKLPDDYYDVSEIVRRAVVKAENNGYYTLQRKGILRMRKQ